MADCRACTHCDGVVCLVLVRLVEPVEDAMDCAYFQPMEFRIVDGLPRWPWQQQRSA